MKMSLKPSYVTDEKGQKTSGIIPLRDYENMIDSLDNLEGACDLLKAEREAAGFIPYEIFRKKFLKGSLS